MRMAKRQNSRRAGFEKCPILWKKLSDGSRESFRIRWHAHPEKMMHFEGIKF